MDLQFARGFMLRLPLATRRRCRPKRTADLVTVLLALDQGGVGQCLAITASLLGDQPIQRTSS